MKGIHYLKPRCLLVKFLPFYHQMFSIRFISFFKTLDSLKEYCYSLWRRLLSLPPRQGPSVTRVSRCNVHIATCSLNPLHSHNMNRFAVSLNKKSTTNHDGTSVPGRKHLRLDLLVMPVMLEVIRISRFHF